MWSVVDVPGRNINVEYSRMYWSGKRECGIRQVKGVGVLGGNVNVKYGRLRRGWYTGRVNVNLLKVEQLRVHRGVTVEYSR
jgi:hypothetical protein